MGKPGVCAEPDMGFRKEGSMRDKYLDTIVVNRGNQKRLKNLMLRARAGESVAIGYLGAPSPWAVMPLRRRSAMPL